MSVHDALIRWYRLLSQLPPGQPVDVAEEGASPGPGVPMVVSQVLRLDGSAAVLAIAAGTYDGEPRVLARVFEAARAEDLADEVVAWRREVQGR